jgi:hypothetical protein
MRAHVHVAVARKELQDALVFMDDDNAEETTTQTQSYNKVFDWDAFMDVWYELLTSRSREYIHELIMFRDTTLQGDKNLLEFVCHHGSASDEMCSFAARRGYVAPIELFEQMLEIAPEAARNINPNNGGLSALMSCIRRPEASVEVVRLLLTYDPDNIAIHTACASSSSSLHQLQFQPQQHLHCYPIHQAMSHERMDIVESLLLADMDGQMALQDKTVNGDTCLHVALKGHTRANTICDYLAIAPQAASVANGDGSLPLHTALHSYRRAILLLCGGKGGGETKLEWAMLERNQVIRLLLRLYPEALYYAEPESGLVPWMMIASGSRCLPDDPADLTNSFELLRMAPDSFNRIHKPNERFQLAYYHQEQARIIRNPYGLVSILAQPGKLDFWWSDTCDTYDKPKAK